MQIRIIVQEVGDTTFECETCGSEVERCKILQQEVQFLDLNQTNMDVSQVQNIAMEMVEQVMRKLSATPVRSFVFQMLGERWEN